MNGWIQIIAAIIMELIFVFVAVLYWRLSKKYEAKCEEISEIKAQISEEQRTHLEKEKLSAAEIKSLLNQNIHLRRELLARNPGLRNR